MTAKTWIEDALKHLHEADYAGREVTQQGIAGALGIGRTRSAELLSELVATGLIERHGDCFRLTGEGHAYAAHVVRVHRLYETYLARMTGYKETDWHHRAELKEHEFTTEDGDRLARQLGDPRFDPHGDPIPTSQGELPPRVGHPLLHNALHNMERDPQPPLDTSRSPTATTLRHHCVRNLRPDLATLASLKQMRVAY